MTGFKEVTFRCEMLSFSRSLWRFYIVTGIFVCFRAEGSEFRLGSLGFEGLRCRV